MSQDPEWNQGALMEIFAPFTSCDIVIRRESPSEPRANVEWTGISGVTLFWLAVPEVAFGSDLLSSFFASADSAQTLRDIITCPVTLGDKITCPAPSTHFSLLWQGILGAIHVLLFEVRRPTRPISIAAICGHVSLLLQAYVRHLHSQFFTSTTTIPTSNDLIMALKDTLQTLSSAYRTKPSEYMTNFRYGQDEETLVARTGTPQFVLMGLYYGCAVASIMSMVLTRIRERERYSTPRRSHTRLASQWATSLTDLITSGVLKGGVSPLTDQAREALKAYLAQRLDNASPGDVDALKGMLQHVRRSVIAILNSYDSVLDSNHFLQRFCQAFVNGLMGETQEDLNCQAVCAWYSRHELTDDLKTACPTNSGKIDFHFGDMFYSDLSEVHRVDYSSRELAVMLTEMEWKAQKAKESTMKAIAVEGLQWWTPQVQELLIRSRQRTVTERFRFQKLLVAPPPRPASPDSADGYLRRFTQNQLIMMATAALTLLLALILAADPSQINSGVTNATGFFAARVMQDFKVRSAFHLTRGDIVLIRRSPFIRWFCFEDSIGRIGVSSRQ
ncbi:hypothetical protein A1Q1_03084 [Trichosporon asahii var. asahii CBS 2479]|uniref:Uncharacterized protein n=1 Tax=Trichosporon asahii var. asahii (strain ATCC 90039 / CBS 2479 / JCM 2466 / KCTC 7840 / NBRC 103889/ NCYC 2677 / UAMH 7654) TaxID=1186058 RepID=J4UL24_TRIAS|nr:hypothetical protein A1Q1_03084 [Trichosporon asahii var. asahii CBS 2479]EJT52630.1 hypothetical protein A1Q1_03084 [Trichosporon asahii var. asahii CBS 2479]